MLIYEAVNSVSAGIPKRIGGLYMILNMKRVNKMKIKGERKHSAFDMYVFIALAAIEGV